MNIPTGIQVIFDVTSGAADLGTVRTDSDVDYLFVDMPPGTGETPLTVFQSLPVDGIVVITSPRPGEHDRHQGGEDGADDECSILGLVENYSCFVPRLRQDAPDFWQEPSGEHRPGQPRSRARPGAH